MNSKREVGFQILVNFYCFFRINMLERHQTPIKSKCFILHTAETCHREGPPQSNPVLSHKEKNLIFLTKKFNELTVFPNLQLFGQNEAETSTTTLKNNPPLLHHIFSYASASSCKSFVNIPWFICSNWNGCKIKGSISLSNLLKNLTVARVSSKEKPMFCTNNGPTAP